MQKSADAFRTISEVADDLSLPQHVLRFWETRFPQIRPLKRAGGRRYYRPADVLLLRTIRQLLYDDGYTIKGVQRLLKEQGAKGLGHSLGGSALAADVVEPEDPSHAAFEQGEDVDDSPRGLSPDERAPFSDARYRDLVEGALATVDECRRLLEAVLRPVR